MRGERTALRAGKGLISLACRRLPAISAVGLGLAVRYLSRPQHAGAGPGQQPDRAMS